MNTSDGTKSQDDEFEDQIFARRDMVSSREDLAKYLEFLESNYNAGKIEQKDAGDLIGDASDIVSGLEVLLKQDGLSLPEQPTWKLVARIMTGALLRD